MIFYFYDYHYDLWVVSMTMSMTMSMRVTVSVSISHYQYDYHYDYVLWFNFIDSYSYIEIEWLIDDSLIFIFNLRFINTLTCWSITIRL